MTADTSTPGITIGSFELTARIEVLRQKCRDGTATKEELMEGLAAMRQGRINSGKATGGSKTRAKSVKAPVKSGDDLLSELDDL